MKEKVTYIANDGKEFEDKESCLKYEKDNSNKEESWKKICSILDALFFEVMRYEDITNTKLMITRSKTGYGCTELSTNIKKPIDEFMKFNLE